jgi:hypothetical protein
MCGWGGRRGGGYGRVQVNDEGVADASEDVALVGDVLHVVQAQHVDLFKRLERQELPRRHAPDQSHPAEGSGACAVQGPFSKP